MFFLFGDQLNSVDATFSYRHLSKHLLNFHLLFVSPFHHAFLEINELRISRSSFHRLQLYWVTWIAASQRCSSNSSHTRRVIDFMYRWFLNPCQWRPASLNAYMKFYIFFKGICKWCLFGNADHHQGSPGQGNYSAANMALDAHARYWKVRFWWCLVESRYNQIGYDDIIRISLHDWCEQVESNQYSHGDIQFWQTCIRSWTFSTCETQCGK